MRQAIVEVRWYSSALNDYSVVSIGKHTPIPVFGDDLDRVDRENVLIFG